MNVIDRAARMLAGLQRRREPDEIERAVRELSAYSDRELADLGISRGVIREVVRLGRPGVDCPPAVNGCDRAAHRRAA